MSSSIYIYIYYIITARTQNPLKFEKASIAHHLVVWPCGMKRALAARPMLNFSFTSTSLNHRQWWLSVLTMLVKFSWIHWATLSWPYHLWFCPGYLEKLTGEDIIDLDDLVGADHSLQSFDDASGGMTRFATGKKIAKPFVATIRYMAWVDSLWAHKGNAWRVFNIRCNIVSRLHLYYLWTYPDSVTSGPLCIYLPWKKNEGTIIHIHGNSPSSHDWSAMDSDAQAAGPKACGSGKGVHAISYVDSLFSKQQFLHLIPASSWGIIARIDTLITQLTSLT